MTREKDTARNEGNQFQPYVAFSWLGGVMMAIALIAFLVEIIGTLGFADVLRLFVPTKRGVEQVAPSGS